MESIGNAVSCLANIVGQVIKAVIFPVRFVFNRVVYVVSSVVSYLKGDRESSGNISATDQSKLEERKVAVLKTWDFAALKPMILELKSLMVGQTDFFEQQRSGGLFNIEEGERLFRWCVGRPFGDESDSLKAKFNSFFEKLPDGNIIKITSANLEGMLNLACLTESSLHMIRVGEIFKTAIYPKTKEMVDNHLDRVYKLRCSIHELLDRPRPQPLLPFGKASQ
ncbi:hypothetical protein [Endozoicomonas elysicola]|uniref:Uncharacterized protein n=1 Tax=Endozoicomonas elysicola TaxID=305900 RepID=A0A081K6T4_9GAMM|nr:hypothetical protein [Endozoicomonas elysicola]KEI69860.1 hypothetical protein GV64_03080 [Endozoicomonas elysicola]